MLTRQDAETRGWTFDTVDGAIEASKDGDVRARIVSDCPLFFALRTVTEFEGEPLAEQVTAADVLAATGETLIEDLPVEAAVTAAAAETDQLVAALEQLPPDQPVTAAELLAILRPQETKPNA